MLKKTDGFHINLLANYACSGPIKGQAAMRVDRSFPAGRSPVGAESPESGKPRETKAVAVLFLLIARYRRKARKANALALVLHGLPPFPGMSGGKWKACF